MKSITLTKLTRFWNKAKAYIDNGLSGKVTAVEGMGLSSNDFTTADKEKLDSITEATDAEIDAIFTE